MAILRIGREKSGETHSFLFLLKSKGIENLENWICNKGGAYEQ